MLKKALGVAFVLALVGAGVYVWARVTLGSESVRTAVAARASETLGQPVAIGSIRPRLLPRPAISLGDVRIGDPARIVVARVDVGASLIALVSRRVEHASIRADGVRVDLPLPPLSLRPPSGEGGPLEIVSIDEIRLTGVTVAGGEHTFDGELDLVPDGRGLTIRRVSLAGGNTTLEATGRLSDLAGPVGAIAVDAETLDMTDLAALSRAFGATEKPAPAGASTAGTSKTGRLSLAITLDADRALLGPVALDGLTGDVQVTPESVDLRSMAFGLYDGSGQGSGELSLGAMRTYRLQARLEGMDVAAAMAAAGRPDSLTGRLNGTIDVEGRGDSAGIALQSATGTARLDASDGTVEGLGLVSTVSTLTSGAAGLLSVFTSRPDSAPAADAYSRAGLSLTIADGLARTDDFRFEALDVELTATGTVALDGSAVNLAGRARLSSGMTVPATVTGPVASPRVRVQAGEAMRSLTNINPEEAVKSLLGGLKGLLESARAPD
jgi:uncharacterized protein involved in outer membrane biogenesis